MSSSFWAFWVTALTEGGVVSFDAPLRITRTCCLPPTKLLPPRCCCCCCCVWIPGQYWVGPQNPTRTAIPNTKNNRVHQFYFDICKFLSLLSFNKTSNSLAVSSILPQLLTNVKLKTKITYVSYDFPLSSRVVAELSHWEQGFIHPWTILDIFFPLLGPLHTRDWEPVTMAFQALSLVEKAEPVQVRFTLRLRDWRSMWMQDGCKVHVDSYMASNGSCFMVTWTIQKSPLGGRSNTKLGDHGTLNTHHRCFILFYHVWGPAWKLIHWSSIWLRARSHMTSHYTWGFVTTLHDFGGVLG